MICAVRRKKCIHGGEKEKQNGGRGMERKEWKERGFRKMLCDRK
jgi:hypothetical protein